jgi:deoxyhypusine synthase
MVYAEATSVLPLIISYVYHREDWKKRSHANWTKMLDGHQAINRH